jgi:hypothetical protein
MAPPPFESPKAPAAPPATYEREQKDKETSRSSQQLGQLDAVEVAGATPLHPSLRGRCCARRSCVRGGQGDVLP